MAEKENHMELRNAAHAGGKSPNVEKDGAGEAVIDFRSGEIKSNTAGNNVKAVKQDNALEIQTDSVKIQIVLEKEVIPRPLLFNPLDPEYPSDGLVIVSNETTKKLLIGESAEIKEIILTRSGIEITSTYLDDGRGRYQNRFSLDWKSDFGLDI